MAAMKDHSAAEEQPTQKDTIIYNENFDVIREREFPMLHGNSHIAYYIFNVLIAFYRHNVSRPCWYHAVS